MPRVYRIVAEAVGMNEQLAGYQTNDVYMAVRFRAMSTKPNKNGDVIERSFMNSICDNPDFYVGTPVKVDIDHLLNSKRLGHNYDRIHREWRTDQIGSILDFEIEETPDEDILYCTARIEKGRADVCAAIEDLYEEGALAFSFEIVAKDVRVENGFTYIGSGDNYLTAMCVVSVPAYEDGYAVALVAETENDMEENVVIEAEQQVEQPVEEAEVNQVEAEQVEAEQESSECHENEEAEEASCEKDKEAEAVEAAVVQTEVVRIEHSVDQFDTETCESSYVCDEHTEVATTVIEASAEEAVKPIAPDMNALQAELNELRAFKAQIEAEAREKENVKKREKLRIFAERAGANVEALADAIQNLDYETVVMAELAEKKVVQVSASDESQAVIVLDNMHLTNNKKASKWDGYVSDTSGLSN